MVARQTLLFIQLPQLENAVRAPAENLPLASVYLRAALERSEERRHYRIVSLPSDADRLADGPLVDSIVRLRPDILAATLYLWNVERTLAVLGKVRAALPGVFVAVGGPEVAPRHPFLFRSRAVDVAVDGEGEPVFPAVLRAWRRRERLDCAVAAWRRGDRFVRGRGPVRTDALREILPPPAYRHNRPAAGGMGYLETGRGCPWRCAFCCYNQRRRGASFLGADDVLARVRALRRLGTREIRFIDPTFNANPAFEAILRGLAARNRQRGLKFFAELRAESVTPEHAALLAAANVTEVEVGIQSLDPAVLARIRRPTDLAAARRGVRELAGAGIRVTLDVMCGLPGQTLADLRRSLRWAAGIPNVAIQFLHTLLLPGSEIRRNRRRWGLQAQPRPPYRVTETATLSAQDIRAAEAFARRTAGVQMDCPTGRFVGRRLPDLFPEQVTIRLDETTEDSNGSGSRPARPAVEEESRRWAERILRGGRENRRAVVFEGRDLFARRRAMAGAIRRAAAAEPHLLWQFVLAPEGEEPLDLLDALVAAIDRMPGHFLDRMTVSAGGARHAARRLFVRLRRSGRYRRSWIRAVEDYLAERFH